MKKLSAMFFALLFSLSLFSCSSPAPAPEEKADSPLFALSAPTKKSSLAYLSAIKSGFVYFSQADEGFHMGFVSPENSILCDAVISAEEQADFDAVRVFEIEENRALVVAGSKIYLALLDENTAESFPLPEKTSLSDALLYENCAFLYSDAESGLILLAPYDFSQRYVLAKTALLQDFGALLALSPDGKQIYYALQDESGFYGIASFPYGSTECREEARFCLDSFFRLPSGALLFEKAGENETEWTFFNPADKEKISFSTTGHYRSFAMDGTGALFVGLNEESGAFDFIRPNSGIRPLHYSYGDFSCNPSFALSPDGKTLLFSLMQKGKEEEEEIIWRLNLEKYLAN